MTGSVEWINDQEWLKKDYNVLIPLSPFWEIYPHFHCHLKLTAFRYFSMLRRETKAGFVSFGAPTESRSLSGEAPAPNVANSIPSECLTLMVC